MTNAERVFEGGRRLSIVITLLLVIGCLVPVTFSAKQVWDDHQLRATEHRDFWVFAEKETDKIGPWTLFRFEDTRAWRRSVIQERWWDELDLHNPLDSLETDLSELRQRSWKSFADKATGPLEFAAGGVLVIFAIRKALGWVVRGFLG